MRSSLHWREAAEEARPSKKYPKDAERHEAQMTFLSNRLKNAQAGYEQQQVIADANRREVLE